MRNYYMKNLAEIHPSVIMRFSLSFVIKMWTGSSHCGSAEINLTSIRENSGSIPGLTQWVKVAVSCGVGHICSSDPALWPRYKPAATVLIGPLAWEPPYAKGAAQKRQKKKMWTIWHFSLCLLVYFYVILLFYFKT